MSAATRCAAVLVALVPLAAACGADLPEPAAEPPVAVEATLPAPLDGPVHAVDPGAEGLVWPPSLAALPESRRARIPGMDLDGPDGTIGEIERLLANDEREVVAVTVEIGGLLGLDDEEVIVPLNRIEFGPTGDTFITAMSEDELEALPSWQD